MSLRIFNTLTGSKVDFVPLDGNKVKMYVCGMTVYDRCHLGHARVMVSFDMVARWLRHLGYDLTYVRNITDVDDKILAKYVEHLESKAFSGDLLSFTERYVDLMHEDQARLNVLPPDIEPRATDHIDLMLDLINQLLLKDLAYVALNGDVYFSVRKFSSYGSLSGKSLDELISGARIESDLINKKDPLDFVLWKASKADEPINWRDSRGKIKSGRPGWHIECSAMAVKYLGTTIDIHGGGEDLIFPHHENEIAQSESIFGGPFVRYWMHNAFIKVNSEKMSKSLGNSLILSDLLDQFGGETIRLFLALSHYRSPIDFSENSLLNARSSLTKLYNSIQNYECSSGKIFNLDPASVSCDSVYYLRFAKAMNDDFNTPVAISIIFELSNEINRSLDFSLLNLMVYLSNFLGFLYMSTDEFFGKSEVSAKIQELINKRAKARAAGDFVTSDQIRDILKSQGVEVSDSARGTVWKKIKT